MGNRGRAGRFRRRRAARTTKVFCNGMLLIAGFDYELEPPGTPPKMLFSLKPGDLVDVVYVGGRKPSFRRRTHWLSTGERLVPRNRPFDKMLEQIPDVESVVVGPTPAPVRGATRDFVVPPVVADILIFVSKGVDSVRRQEIALETLRFGEYYFGRTPWVCVRVDGPDGDALESVARLC